MKYHVVIALKDALKHWLSSVTANNASFQRRLSIVQHTLVFLPFRKASAQTRLIPFIGRHIQTIHDRHPARQFAVGLHFHVVLTPLISNCRIERNAHGNRIRQRNAILSGLLFVSLAGPAVALDGKAGKCVLESQNVRDVAPG